MGFDYPEEVVEHSDIDVKPKAYLGVLPKKTPTTELSLNITDQRGTSLDNDPLC